MVLGCKLQARIESLGYPMKMGLSKFYKQLVVSYDGVLP